MGRADGTGRSRGCCMKDLIAVGGDMLDVSCVVRIRAMVMDMAVPMAMAIAMGMDGDMMGG